MHDYQSVETGSQVIEIVNASIGNYFIGVWPTGDSKTSSDVTFSIVVGSDCININGETTHAPIANVTKQPNRESAILQNGVPDTMYLESGETQHYTFSVSEPNLHVVISVTAISGDPDLYVSRHPWANYTKFDWSAITVGSDVIELSFYCL